jgi:hypothetical protein
MRKFVLAILFFASIVPIKAQKNDFAIIPNAGVALGVLSSGAGLHAGVNSTYGLSRRLSAEAQIYVNTMSGQTGFGGRSFSESSAGFLAGLRLYFQPPTKKTRIFINYLVGAHSIQTRYPGEPPYKGIEGSSSLGLYFSVDNRIFFGSSLEGDGYLVLKAGINVRKKKTSGKS